MKSFAKSQLKASGTQLDDLPVSPAMVMADAVEPEQEVKKEKMPLIGILLVAAGIGAILYTQFGKSKD